MKKLSKFQPQLVTDTFTGADKDCAQDPRRINKGLCMRWAFIAYYMFENVELWYMSGHAFIKHNGKFYDSERLNGEEDWKDLPACNWGHGCGCNGCKKGAAKHSEKEFRKFWEGNYIKPNWGWYVKMAMDAVEKHGRLLRT